MAGSNRRPDSDIVNEKYEGTGAIVSALGQGAIDTKFAWLGGLTIGGALAFFNYRKVNTAIEAAQKFGNTLRDSDHTVVKTFGKISLWLFGQGNNHVLHDIESSIALPKNAKRAKEAVESFINGSKGGAIHTLSSELLKLIPPLEKYVKNKGTTEQFDATVMGAGFSAFLSMIGWSIIGGEHGIAQSNAGKNQFKRAQSEIKELREDVQFLDDKNAELRKEIRTIKETPINATRDDAATVKEIAATETATEQHEALIKRKDDARHSNHAERLNLHEGPSHGDTIRAQQAEASTRENAVGA
jgi:hypothetical protein